MPDTRGESAPVALPTPLLRPAAAAGPDGLAGWHRTARVPVPRWPGAEEPDRDSEAFQRAALNTARWSREGDVITSSQEPPGSGLGGYLVSDAAYDDFEFEIDVWPDWPADTGILVRATPDGTRGFQILLDHRKSGNIGGFFGNGIGSFHAIAFTLDAERDGDTVRLIAEDPATTLEPMTADKPALLAETATVSEFLAAWNPSGWNRVSIRCEGTYPVITTWINGVRIARLDTGTLEHPHYDREAVAKLLGERGHIALEVHDHDARMGVDRWGADAVVRWRNPRITEL
ncbi:3-keto-disaccharide hydrolase [Mycetocola tolaasinivorans]|nr:DUF1080 domain-containing protein [Mycetocola tolaasinivorans]